MLNKSEKDKYYMISLVWSLKKYNKSVNITEKKQSHRENKLVVTSGGQLCRGGRGKLGVWCKIHSRMYGITQSIINI